MEKPIFIEVLPGITVQAVIIHSIRIKATYEPLLKELRYNIVIKAGEEYFEYNYDSKELAEAYYNNLVRRLAAGRIG